MRKLKIAPKLRLLLQELMKMFVGRAANVFMNFIILAVISRLVDKATFGVYLTLLSFALFASYLSRFGLEQVSMSMAREVIGSRENVVRLAKHFLPMFLFGQILVILFGLTIFLVPEYRILLNSVLTVGAIFMFVVLFAFQNILGEFFRANRNFLYASLSKGTVLYLFALVGIVGYSLLTGPAMLQSTSIWMIMMVASAGSALFLIVKFFQNIPQSDNNEDGKDYQLDWGSLGRPVLFMLSSVLLFLTSQSDIWISAYVFGPEKTGEYAAAAKVVLLVTFFASMINGWSIPDLARFKLEKDHTQFEMTLRASSFLNFLIGIFVTSLFYIFSEVLLTMIFGAGYTDAASILRILLLGQFVSVLVGPAGYGLVILDMARRTVLCSAIGFSVSVTIAMVFWAGGDFSILKLAIAYSVGNAVFQLLLFVAIRHLGISTLPSYRAFREKFVAKT